MAFVEQFHDTFTEAVADVLLTAHTPDTGIGWSVTAGSAGNNAKIDFATDVGYQPYHGGSLDYNGYIANISGAWADDQRASRKLQTISNSEKTLVAVRLQEDAITAKANGYGGSWKSNFWRLYRLDSGLEVQIGTFYDNAPLATDVVMVEAVGTTIRLFKNGVEIISATDATHSSGGSPSLALQRSGSPTAAAFDDFRGFDEQSTGGNVSVPMPGASAVSSVGDILVSVSTSVQVAGVESQTVAGNLSVSTQSDAFVTVPGSDATGSVGSISVLAGGSASTIVPGVESSGSSGQVVAETASFVSATVPGAEAIGDVGQISVSLGASAEVPGAESSAGAGDIAVTAGGVVSVIVQGAVALAEAGDIQADVQVFSSVPVPGAEAISAAGDIAAGSSTSVSVNLDGSSAIGTAGSITVSAGTAIEVLSVSSSGEAGTISVGGDLSIIVTGVVAVASAGVLAVPSESGMVYIDGVITIAPVLSGDITIN